MDPTQDGDCLARIKSFLDGADIPFFICGSLASTAYSQPRVTHDVDIVINPTVAQLDALVAALAGADCYVSPEAAREAAHEALRTRSMFNAIDLRKRQRPVDL